MYLFHFYSSHSAFPLAIWPATGLVHLCRRQALPPQAAVAVALKVLIALTRVQLFLASYRGDLKPCNKLEIRKLVRCWNAFTLI